MAKNVFILFIIVSIFSVSLCPAQFQITTEKKETADTSKYGPQLGTSEKQIWRAGIVIEPGAEMSDVSVSVPIPMEWFEQKVLKINEEKTDAALSGKIKYRTVNGGAKEMILDLGKMRPHRQVEIVVAVELQNYELLPPAQTDCYVIPKRVPRDVSQYLKESPKIESDKHNRIFQKLYNDITKDKTADWEKVEAVYRYVQDNVKYNDAGRALEAKGAYALTQMPDGQKEGDCKDMCCLFTAICRAGKVPARLVRVPEHCYAEFYLQLKDGTETSAAENTSDDTPKTSRVAEIPKGFWFPCQVAGTYSFGGVPERRVILQKGDSYPDREKDSARAKKLFLNECFQGNLAPNSPQPKFRWIHEVKAM
ncbi:transglutaminase [Planctomycetales bacterium]|nr:transglutaminase [Planctomycetales bacterium]